VLLWLELLVGEAWVRRRWDVLWLVGVNGELSWSGVVGVVAGASRRVAARVA
jgi:hypothetical protein